MHNTLTQTGLHLEDLKMNTKIGMETASAMGFRVIEVGAASGEITPEALSASGRRHVQRYVKSLGLTVAALDADLGGIRLTDSSKAEQHVERTRKILELASDLKVPLVTAPIGRLTGNDQQQFTLVNEALQHIGMHADSIGLPFAIETSVDSPQLLQKLLQDANCPYLKVCYDPGELLMDGHDPLAPVEMLADDIALSHLRDAMLGTPLQPGREMPLGQGQLNLQAFLAQLDQAGYRGPHIIRRANSDNPTADLKAAITHLESILP